MAADAGGISVILRPASMGKPTRIPRLGEVATDASGTYRFKTILPGAPKAARRTSTS